MLLSIIKRSPDTPESEKVLIDWQINSKGNVFEAEVVRDEFSNKEFQNCLGTNISKILFPIPPSRNSVYVEHTFNKSLSPHSSGRKLKNEAIHLGI